MTRLLIVHFVEFHPFQIGRSYSAIREAILLPPRRLASACALRSLHFLRSRSRSLVLRASDSPPFFLSLRLLRYAPRPSFSRSRMRAICSPIVTSKTISYLGVRIFCPLLSLPPPPPPAARLNSFAFSNITPTIFHRA